MSIFNEVRVSVICPQCGMTGVVGVQFRFGELWQYQYEIGDALRWGVNDVGSPDAIARVLGYFECPACRQLIPAEVAVDHGRIVSARVIGNAEERELIDAEDTRD